jgi:hypothetical protein
MKASFSPLPTRYALSASASPFAFAAAKLFELLLVSVGPLVAAALRFAGAGVGTAGALAAAEAPANRPAQSFGGGALTGARAGTSTFSACGSDSTTGVGSDAPSVLATGSVPFSLSDRVASRSRCAAFGRAGMTGIAGIGARVGLVGVTVAVVDE